MSSNMSVVSSSQNLLATAVFVDDYTRIRLEKSEQVDVDLCKKDRYLNPTSKSNGYERVARKKSNQGTFTV